MPEYDPRKEIPHDIEFGQVYEDSRTGDLLQLLYVDRNVYIFQETDGRHRFGRMSEFRDNVREGRYSYKPNEQAFANQGVLDRVRQKLESYREQDGRKAAHLAQGMSEALDILLDINLEEHDEPIPFEDLDNIGEKAAGNLRDSGYETCADVMRASDEDLLDVSWVGEAGVESIRAWCA